MGKRVAALLLVVLASLACAALAGAEVTQSGNVRLSVTAELRPRRLPRVGASPISVSFAGRISTTDGAIPPLLQSFQIDINRYGQLDLEGLPTCNSELIMSASSSRALAACGAALVGQGKFSPTSS